VTALPPLLAAPLIGLATAPQQRRETAASVRAQVPGRAAATHTALTAETLR
jgi:hypothetical protein